MIRGDVIVCTSRGVYTGKPRAMVIIQPDHWTEVKSVVTCPFTGDARDIPSRLLVRASPENGLRKNSYLMLDKIAAIPKQSCKEMIGHLSDKDMRRLEYALCDAFGLPCF